MFLTTRRGYARVATLTLGGLAAMAVAAPAPFAAPPGDPVAGCPESYEESSAGGYTGGLWEIKKMKFAQVSKETLAKDDRNQDGYLCVKFVEQFPEDRFFPAFVYHDNSTQ